MDNLENSLPVITELGFHGSIDNELKLPIVKLSASPHPLRPPGEFPHGETLLHQPVSLAVVGKNFNGVHLFVAKEEDNARVRFLPEMLANSAETGNSFSKIYWIKSNVYF